MDVPLFLLDIRMSREVVMVVVVGVVVARRLLYLMMMGTGLVVCHVCCLWGLPYLW